MLTVYVGYDSREADAYEACVRSLRSRSSCSLRIVPIVLAHVRAEGLYTRTHEQRGSRVWDAISDAPMATEFALTRFLVPWLSNHHGQALFCDCDFLWRADVSELFDLYDSRCAVQVVKHARQPFQRPSKMDSQIQTDYPRKLWSSLVLWNCGHPAHCELSLADVNTRPGRWLHAFEWLDDAVIGSLPLEWNWLAGISDPAIDPKAVHYTLGVPSMPGYANSPYADEWRRNVGAKHFSTEEAST